MFTSYGRLKYDPISVSKNHTKFEPNWAILLCSNDLAAYYRDWLWREGLVKVSSDYFFSQTKLQPPNSKWEMVYRGIKTVASAWSAHVSLIRGENPDQKYWGRYEDEEIAFQYDPQRLNFNGKHFYIPISCPRGEQIRLEMGLEREPTYYAADGSKKSGSKYEKIVSPLHITIGAIS